MSDVLLHLKKEINVVSVGCGSMVSHVIYSESTLCRRLYAGFNILETKVKHYENNRMLFSYHQMEHNIYQNGGTNTWQSQN